MAERCPKAIYLGNTILKGWRLTFKSVATIEEQVGEDLQAGIFEISDQCEKALDIYEDYPKLYDKHNLDVNLNDTLVTAMTYIMVANYGISPPSGKYFEVIREGYKNCGLDLDFLFEAKKYSMQADSGEGYKSARWHK